MSDRIGVLFVCLGNICRSPLAKFVFADLARRSNVIDRLLIDSCGTGHWHAGEQADPRTVAIARKHNLDTTHTARVLDPMRDFERFHYLLPMDTENRRRLLSLGAPPEKVRLLRSFDPVLRDSPEHELIVPDPYYAGEDGFERTFVMVRAACEGLLKHLLENDLKSR
jgi:protein-tyrosine phosphatase